MPWQTPKTDWTASDYYNYGDLNRVESNTNELTVIMQDFFAVPVLSVTTTRDNTSIEFYDSLNRVEGNILAIKNATYQPVDWVTPKTNWITLDPFSNVAANRLELNLLNLYNLIVDTIDYIPYCGTLYAGQDSTYLL